ncbi:MAG: hypothetical protein V4498_04030, partial [candidate division FCPU426 bacterium]
MRGLWASLSFAMALFGGRAFGACGTPSADIRGVWLEPAFLCAGQTVTVHFEARRGDGCTLN